MDPDTLVDVERIAREAQADPIAEEARALAARAAEGRFYVAVLGQFKRGKSTFLNALLGDRLLPTGVVPVTSVPTIIRRGERAARVGNADGTWRAIEPNALSDYVSEEGNPGNTRQVRAVEVFAPSEMLSSGLCFVDTPGLGSIVEANDATTRAFVPHIDAAVIVLGADPPISGDELRLVEEVGSQVSALTFALNKADRVDDEERAEAARFAHNVLAERLGRPVPRIFHVSALDRLTSGRARWEWGPFAEHLQRLARDSGRGLVAGAVRRGAARLGAQLDAVLSEEEAALQRPLEETEQRLSALRAAAHEAERSVLDLGPLFAAEERRLEALFAERRAAFLRSALPDALDTLSRGIQSGAPGSGHAIREHAFRLARQTAESLVTPWLEESEREAEEAFRSASERFAQVANGLLQRLREADPWATALLPDEAAGTEWDTRRRFLFHSFQHLSSPAGAAAGLRWLADALLPRAAARRRAERDARAYLERLMQANTARVQNGIRERVREARSHVEDRLRALLNGMRRAAEQAIERAREAHAQGEEAVAGALARTRALRAQLQRVRQAGE